MENKFREKLEPKIREKSVHLRTFTFTKLDFGRKVSAARGGQPGPGLCPLPPVTAGRRDPTELPRGPGPHLHCPAPGPPSRPLAPGPQHHQCRSEETPPRTELGWETIPGFLSQSLKGCHAGWKPARYKMSKSHLLPPATSWGNPPLGVRWRLGAVRDAVPVHGFWRSVSRAQTQGARSFCLTYLTPHPYSRMRF